MANDTPKSPLLSKSVWLGAAITAAGIVSLLQANPTIAEYPKATAVLAVIAGALSICIRFLTKEPLSVPSGLKAASSSWILAPLATAGILVGGYYAVNSDVTTDTRPKVADSPESWIITNDGGLRIESHDVELIVGTLPPSTYKAVGIPRPGGPFTYRTLSVLEGVINTPVITTTTFNPTRPSQPPVVTPPTIWPVRTPGFRCLLTYEKMNGTPKPFADPKLDSFLDSKCVKDKDGHSEWYREDNDTDFTGTGVWAELRKQIPPGSVEQAWASFGDGDRGWAGQVDESLEPSGFMQIINEKMGW